MNKCIILMLRSHCTRDLPKTSIQSFGDLQSTTIAGTDWFLGWSMVVTSGRQDIWRTSGGHLPDNPQIISLFLANAARTWRCLSDVSQMPPRCCGEVLETWLRPGKKVEMSCRCPDDVLEMSGRYCSVIAEYLKSHAVTCFLQRSIALTTPMS